MATILVYIDIEIYSYKSESRKLSFTVDTSLLENLA